MDVKLKFLGGAGSVTGSKHLLEINDKKILLDCGLFQGLKELRLRNWHEFPINPDKIDLIIISHAHIDHCGYLPKLVKDGFSGPIYCTDASTELMKLSLLDAAKLQEEEAEFAAKKGYSKHQKPEPLYRENDVHQTIHLFKEVPFNEPIQLFTDVQLTYRNSGHILGAASVLLTIQGITQQKKIVFSGDIGRYNDPILYDPENFDHADVLLIESTYGNRSNPAGNTEEELKNAVINMIEKKGCMVIPAFSIGRTQTLLYYFNQLFTKKSIPDLPVFIDSPMAISVTDIYKKHSHLHKLKDDDLSDGHELFDHKNFKYARSKNLSQQINDLEREAIIISAGGMCSGGRIMHHLFHRLSRKNDTLLFVGYQGEGTRGRRILDGENEIKIFGQFIPVHCQVEQIHGFSAHADKEELQQWALQLKEKPKNTFIVHGELESSNHMKQWFHQNNWNSHTPKYLETHSIFTNI